ncbi:nosL-related protein [hydrothermal vent metagenome]|uniref:NosL-related protein n=1 Tax=hydrothermal vent metagenome TaxID=652676 RepID=A0A1W1EAF3_9ZZZZ
MNKIIWIALWSIQTLYATQNSSAIEIKRIEKGSRIVQAMCDQSKLPANKEENITIEALTKKIKRSKVCLPLSKRKLQAVAYYLLHQKVELHKSCIVVPKDAKCPVCGMFVSKYPKWTTMMIVDNKKRYFDGVKDMMKYYIFDGDFVYPRDHITKMSVSDYYTLEEIPAKKAFYVLDSDIFGPMGRELIPFKNQKSAQVFLEDHNGKSIVKFDEITDTMLMGLDGLK